MNIIQRMAAGTLFLAGSAFAEPSKPAETSAARADEAQGEEKSGSRPDSWITTKVKASLMFRKSVNGMSTEVETNDGVVTLRGKADNQAQKELAEDYAAEIEGVKRVDNQITVKGERTIESRVDDASITAQVKSALLTRRATSALNTSVKTTGGVVTLSGVAQNEAEKELAERVARGIRGVHHVVNEMTIEYR